MQSYQRSSQQESGSLNLNFQEHNVHRNIAQLKSLLSNKKQLNRKNRMDLSPDISRIQTDRQGQIRSPFYVQKPQPQHQHSFNQKDTSSTNLSNKINIIRKSIIEASPSRFKGCPDCQPSGFVYRSKDIDTNLTLQTLVEQNASLISQFQQSEIICKEKQCRIAHLEKNIQNLNGLLRKSQQQHHQTLYMKDRQIHQEKQINSQRFYLMKRAITQLSVALFQKMESIGLMSQKKLIEYDTKLQQLNQTLLFKAKQKVKLQKLIFPVNSSNDPLFHRKSKHSLQQSPSVKGDKNQQMQANNELHFMENQQLLKEINQQRQKYHQNIRFYENKYNQLLKGFTEMKEKNELLNRQLQIIRIKQEQQGQHGFQTNFVRSDNKAAVLKRYAPQSSISSHQSSSKKSHVQMSRTRSPSHNPSANFNYFKINVPQNRMSRSQVTVQANFDEIAEYDRRHQIDKNTQNIQRNYVEQILHIKNMLQTVSDSVVPPQKNIRVKNFDQQRQSFKKVKIGQNHNQSQSHSNSQSNSQSQSQRKSATKSVSKYSHSQSTAKTNLRQISKVQGLAKKQKRQRQLTECKLKKLQRELEYQKFKNKQLQELTYQNGQKKTKQFHRKHEKYLEEIRERKKSQESMILQEQTFNNFSNNHQLLASENTSIKHSVKNAGIQLEKSIKDNLSSAIRKLDNLQKNMNLQSQCGIRSPFSIDQINSSDQMRNYYKKESQQSKQVKLPDTPRSNIVMRDIQPSNQTVIRASTQRSNRSKSSHKPALSIVSPKKFTKTSQRVAQCKL